MTTHPLLGWRSPAGSIALVLAMAGCARLPPTAAFAIPPVPAQEARIWFYRDLDPNGSMATPYVRLNGAVAGVSQAGAPFTGMSHPGIITSAPTAISPTPS
jgi:hypothetical protein